MSASHLAFGTAYSLWMRLPPLSYLPPSLPAPTRVQRIAVGVDWVGHVWLMYEAWRLFLARASMIYVAGYAERLATTSGSFMSIGLLQFALIRPALTLQTLRRAAPAFLLSYLGKKYSLRATDPWRWSALREILRAFYERLAPFRLYPRRSSFERQSYILSNFLHRLNTLIDQHAEDQFAEPTTTAGVGPGNVMYLLDEQHRGVLNETARSVALLINLPLEQRRAAARRVASALREQDFSGLQHSKGFAGLTREEWIPLVGLKEWRFKVRQQYIFLAYALIRAEDEDMLHLRHSTCRGGFHFLSAYLRHSYSSWIHLYRVFTIETHRSAEEQPQLPSAIAELLQQWKAAILKLVAYDDVWPKPLYSDTLLATFALYLMQLSRLEKNRLSRRREEVVLDFVLLWKESREESARKG